ncbi:MAG: hypothetical protein KF721_02415 [Ignavibacteriaceae bacterium]|nr:hypothetical protein [Ignavibacteriaceae bacterium]
MKTTKKYNLTLLVLIYIVNFIGCEKEQIVTPSDENKQLFHFSFEASEKTDSNFNVIGYYTAVRFKAIDTKEIPTVIINQDTLSHIVYSSSTNSVSVNYGVPYTDIINFEVIKGNKSTKGSFIMPEEVTNLKCNGFNFKPIRYFDNQSVINRIPDDSVYTVSWDANFDLYVVKVNYNFEPCTLSVPYFSYNASNNIFETGKPYSITLTSFKGINLSSGTEPYCKGTYGSGYVFGSIRSTFKYFP